MGVLSRIFHFYRDGFRSMQLGRTLWAIILIKLFVMFAILKVFFFPAFLQGEDEDKSSFVSQRLIERQSPPPTPKLSHPSSPAL